MKGPEGAQLQPYIHRGDENYCAGHRLKVIKFERKIIISCCIFLLKKAIKIKGATHASIDSALRSP
jgi:hypothetical protein